MINLKIIITMNRKKLLISLAMAMLSMAGLAADNLPALRVQGKNLVDANGKTVVLHGWIHRTVTSTGGDGNSGRLTILKPTLSLAWNMSLSSSRLLPTRSRVLIVPCSDCTWIHVGPTIHRRRQRMRLTSQHSTWRATASICRNSISH